jgi:hypothetical protein
MFWLDEVEDLEKQASRREAGPLPVSASREARRLRAVLTALVAVACVLLGVFVLIAAASGTKAGPKPAVLPDAPFSASVGSDGRFALPPIPTAAATPLPKNRGAAGGASAPAPCSDPDRELHLRVPRLCIDAPLVPTRAHGGELQIPSDVHTVGVWDAGAALTDSSGSAGDSGTTVLAGHVDDASQGNGALHDLYLVKPGEAVYVTDARGRTVRWRAVALRIVVKSALPAELFAGPHGPRRLYLVTCGGKLLHLSDGRGGTYGTYEDNVIVTLVPG